MKNLFVFLVFAINISAAQTNKLESTGNAGIGTTAPSFLLHVKNSSSSADVFIEGAGDGYSYTNLYTKRISSAISGQVEYWNTFNFRQDNYFGAGARALHFYSRISNGSGGGDYRVPIILTENGNVILAGASTGVLDNGKVGIGTVSPNNNLSVVGNSDFAGNVGIGANSPTARLHVNGSVRFEGNGQNNALSRVLVTDENGTLAYRDASTLSGAGNWSLSGSDIFSSNSGFVGINTSVNPAPQDPLIKLAVKGNIYSQKIKVTQTGWADYVFQPGYRLRPLKELDSMISRDKHLPEMPSQAEVQQNGNDIGDTQVLLLKKIEELTLYIIKQDKKIDQQAKKLDMLMKDRQAKKQIQSTTFTHNQRK